MSKEYIGREKVILAVRHAWAKGLEPTQYIEQIPAADVAPVVHGRWIEKTAHDRRRYFECSNCGKQENKHTAIRGGVCWNCGAKMDKEE